MPATLEQIAVSASLAANFASGIVELKQMVERLAADVADIKAQMETKPCR